MVKPWSVPSLFWGKEVTTAVYIQNSSYTHNINSKTPYELWHGKRPNLHYLRVFWCVAHIKTAWPHLKKLEDRGTPMVFLSNEPGSNAYKVFDLVTRRVHITRDTVFDEAHELGLVGG